MFQYIAKIKGIHPGQIIGRELRKRKISQGRFALSIQEYPQTLGAIINGHRGMNTKLSLKIEKELNWEEGLLMSLQVFYDIEQEKRLSSQLKNARPEVREILFWDTDINSIDWQRHKNAVIKRVMERGNAEEKESIKAFYEGKEFEKSQK